MIGRSDCSDDIVVHLPGEATNCRFAIVHLTWGTPPGDAEYPGATMFASAQELSKEFWREAVWGGFVEDFDLNDPDLWPEKES